MEKVSRLLDVEPKFIRLRQALSDTRAEAGFDNYVYMLEAASQSRGLALGWRGLIEGYLETGRLVGAGPDATRSDGAIARPACSASLTSRGRCADDAFMPSRRS